MATAYICPMCVFNCDNLPDLEKHIEAHENNSIQSPVKQQHTNKSVRNSPLYAKSQAVLNFQQKQQQNRSPVTNSYSSVNSSPARSSPNKSYDRRYSCKSCPFTTHSVKAYFNHRQMAHGEQLIITECPFCDYASQYPGKVKKHLTDEHPTQQMPIVESSNGNSLNNSIDESEQINVDNTVKRFTDCPFCSFTSVDTEAFRKHVLSNHINDKNFRCLICNRLYRYRGDCSFHIRKKHSDRMIGDNVESLREYVGEFQPNKMSASELQQILSTPLTSSVSSMSSNGTLNNSRHSPTSSLTQQQQQQNPPHAFRCGYCKFSSVNSGDVKKHQTWKHANLLSNIIPIDPNDPQQQPIASYKRKRVHSTKQTNNEDDDGPVQQRPRLSMPAQRPLTIDTSSGNNIDNDSAPKDLLSPNEPVSSSPMDFDQLSIKNQNALKSTQQSLSAIGALSSRIYKCLRCDRLAPHRWIIERHIRAKHPYDTDDMSKVIIEIDKPLALSNNGEPMTATKSSSSSNDQDAPVSNAPKAFSCSSCSLQAYHLWVILRHIRNVHKNDGSNAKIIDNINNQIIEDTDDLESDKPTQIQPSNTNLLDKRENDNKNDIQNQIENLQNNMNNEDMLKHLLNTAMATRKTNATNALLENLPTSLMNNNVAASLATLLGQLTNKQLLQQQMQTEKTPLIKRYKCSLCSHISAWGGNVKKHLKRMHPGDDSGHVIDLGLDGSINNDSQLSYTSNNKDELDDTNEQELIQTNIHKIQVKQANRYQSYQQSSEIISTKLKDIDNSPSFAPPISTNSSVSQSTRPERLYGCSACSYECTNPTNIHRHVELHCGEDGGGFQCSQCFFLSKWRASIRKHMISTHGSSLASLTNVLEPITLVKSENATVVVKKWLIHENGIKREDDPNNNNTHTLDISVYYCSSCPYTENNRVLFDEHVMHHNLSKRNGHLYACTFCTYHTNEKDSLDDHQMLHILEEDFHQDETANAVENALM